MPFQLGDVQSYEGERCLTGELGLQEGHEVVGGSEIQLGDGFDNVGSGDTLARPS